MPGSKRLIFSFVSVGLLFYILHWYTSRMVEVQKSDCSTVQALQQTFPTNPEMQKWMVWMHKKTISFIWMQLSCFVAFMFSFDIGTEMYLLVLIGHILKNFSKSFIQSPRGFWFCTEGKAIHCGSGYSLPSGHSMMSLLTSMFISYVTKSTIIWLLFFLMESYIIFSVIYLGTHTIMDIVIGFLFAFAYFSCYLAYKHFIIKDHKSNRKGLNSSLVLIVMILITSGVFFLETVEDRIDHETTQPLEYQRNYERYCGLKEGQAAEKMKNSSAFEKTALFLGLTIGYYLKIVIGLNGSQDHQTHIAKKVIRTVFAWYTFSYAKDILILVMGPLTGYWKYTHYVVQPIWLLAVLPLLFHFLKLGVFVPSKTKQKLKKESDSKKNN